MGNYTIEARSARLDIAGTRIGCHDFYVLRDPEGNVIAELHGLAYDPVTEQYQKRGRARDFLVVHNFVHDSDYAKMLGVETENYTLVELDQQNSLVFSGNKEEAFTRWGLAVDAIPALNNLGIHYPSEFGTVFADYVRGAYNSNSVYNTLGQIMGVDVVKFSWAYEPGIDKVLSEGIVNQYCSIGTNIHAYLDDSDDNLNGTSTYSEYDYDTSSGSDSIAASRNVVIPVSIREGNNIHDDR